VLLPALDGPLTTIAMARLGEDMMREWECADTRVADKVSRKLDGFSEAT
jgi:hypothetical protein